jgi:hypothetical protein
VRDVYLTDDPDDAAVLVDKAIAGCAEDDVEEIRALGRTLAAWRSEILAHRTGASNGPTESLNLCVKRVSVAATASDASSTTGCECCCTPVESRGLNGPHGHAFEPAVPTRTRRAR